MKGGCQSTVPKMPNDSRLPRIEFTDKQLVTKEQTDTVVMYSVLVVVVGTKVLPTRPASKSRCMALATGCALGGASGGPATI